MTELPHIQDDDYMVVVNAQVMTRDENKGGWVPLGRGGLSRVGLMKRLVHGRCGGETRHEYRIHGVLDRSEVLDCVLTKDVQYVIANPTFIHWHIEEKRFGLTFQSSRDARAFERGVQQVVDDLLQGAPDKNAKTCIHNLQFPHSARRHVNSGEEEGVFMALELPLMRKGSGSTLSTATTTTTSSPQSPTLHSLHEGFPSFANGSNNVLNGRSPGDDPVMHKVVYLESRSNNKAGNTTPPSSGNSTKSHTSVMSDTSSTVPEHDWIHLENKANERARHLALQQGLAHEKDSADIEFDMDSSSCSYVQFNPAHKKVPPIRDDSTHHEYSYPTFDTSPSASQKQSCSPKQSFSPRPPPLEGAKLQNLSRYPSAQQPPLPTKSNKKRDKRARRDTQNRSLLRSGERARCRYCDETFTVDENPRGACEDAPDGALTCINRVSCINCARALLYHCVSKEENYEDPYDCDTSDENHCKKWTILAVLTVFVPCLWCYGILKCCHRCGTACGCCGGRHKQTT